MLPVVPCAWPESTIVCLGTGPSLTTEDVAFVASRARVIAINNAIHLAPWSDVCYAADRKWWDWNQAIARQVWPQHKYGLQPSIRQHYPRVSVLQRTGVSGLEASPTGLRSGGHSGYQAINLAVHLGARKIVLLGYDLQPSPDGRHHVGAEHPDGSHPTYAQRREVYASLLGPLAARGITILNASRATAISSLPRSTLADALQEARPRLVRRADREHLAEVC